MKGGCWWQDPKADTYTGMQEQKAIHFNHQTQQKMTQWVEANEFKATSK